MRSFKSRKFTQDETTREEPWEPGPVLDEASFPAVPGLVTVTRFAGFGPDRIG